MLAVLWVYWSGLGDNVDNARDRVYGYVQAIYFLCRSSYDLSHIDWLYRYENCMVIIPQVMVLFDS